MSDISERRDRGQRQVPLSVPVLHGNECAYLRRCLKEGWVSSAGPYVGRFEHALADWLGIEWAVATVNGTSALHVAMRVAGVGPGDAVLVPSLTFVGTVNPILYCGAAPIFLDSEPATGALDVEKLASYLKEEVRYDPSQQCFVDRATGWRLKAIVPVALYGHPPDMDPLLELAESYGLMVIEDAAEALGARYNGRKVGTLGQMGCFSFNGNKIITTGGGGMVVTRHRELAERVTYLINQARDDELEYVHYEMGYNYRLTSLQAALGLAQMEFLEVHLQAKRRIALAYQSRLEGVAGIAARAAEAPWAESSFWLYWILLDPRYSESRQGLLRELRTCGVEARPFFTPVHTLRPYVRYPGYRLEMAERMYACGINLPSSVDLTEEDVEYVCDMLVEVLARVGRRGGATALR